jgi:hypothetical protein
LSVTCDRSVVFSRYSGFLHQKYWPPRYNWNINESDIKHHKANLNQTFKIIWPSNLWIRVYLMVIPEMHNAHLIIYIVSTFLLALFKLFNQRYNKIYQQFLSNSDQQRNNTTGVTIGEGTVYPSRAPAFTTNFGRIHIAQSLVFYVVLCWPLLVFFFWPLYSYLPSLWEDLLYCQFPPNNFYIHILIHEYFVLFRLLVCF